MKATTTAWLQPDRYPYVTVWHDSGHYYYVGTRHSSLRAARRARTGRVVDLCHDGVSIVFADEPNARIEVTDLAAFC